MLKSQEMVEVPSNKDVVVKQSYESRATKKFTFDRAFGMESKQVFFQLDVEENITYINFYITEWSLRDSG